MGANIVDQTKLGVVFFESAGKSFELSPRRGAYNGANDATDSALKADFSYERRLSASCPQSHC